MVKKWKKKITERKYISWVESRCDLTTMHLESMEDSAVSPSTSFEPHFLCLFPRNGQYSYDFYLYSDWGNPEEFRKEKERYLRVLKHAILSWLLLRKRLGTGFTHSRKNKSHSHKKYLHALFAVTLLVHNRGTIYLSLMTRPLGMKCVYVCGWLSCHRCKHNKEGRTHNHFSYMAYLFLKFKASALFPNLISPYLESPPNTLLL